MKSLAEIARGFDPAKKAQQMAAELKFAGWKEDERGLWRRRGVGSKMHLCDAHEAMTRGGG